jgi:hypothetical protein
MALAIPVSGPYRLQIMTAAWIKRVAQTVAQEVDAKDREDNEQAGENPHPPCTADHE